MSPSTIGLWIFFGGIIAMSVIRLRYQLPLLRQHVVERHSFAVDSAMLMIFGVGYIVLPVLFAATDRLAFADYDMPMVGVAVGALLLVTGLALFWRTHHDLGKSFSKRLEIYEQHQLVTEGIYGRVRHPMYTAVWLWMIAQPLLVHNAVAGLAGLLGFAVVYFSRVGIGPYVGHEERMLLEHFGEDYEAYVARTGRLWPRRLES